MTNSVKDITLEEEYIGNAVYRKEIKNGFSHDKAKKAGYEAIREDRRLKNNEVKTDE